MAVSILDNNIQDQLNDLNSNLANVSWGSAVSISSGQTSPYTGLLLVVNNPSNASNAYVVVKAGNKNIRVNAFGGFAENVFGPVSKGDLVSVTESSTNARVSMSVIPLVFGN